MEYVQGESLAQALRRGPLEPGRVAAIARDLGEALDHVHGQGVVHRDVKPANVLLRDDGVAKLADLGIATAADQTRITRSGDRAGQRRLHGARAAGGRARSARPRTSTRWRRSASRRSAGARPAPGRTPLEIAHSVADEPPPDVRDHAPDAAARRPPRRWRAGWRATPAERQRSAGELADELASALERRGAGSGPSGAPTAPTPAASAPRRPRGVRSSRRRSRSRLLAAGGGGRDRRRRCSARRRATASRSRRDAAQASRPREPRRRSRPTATARSRASTAPGRASRRPRTRRRSTLDPAPRRRAQRAGLRADGPGRLRGRRAGPAAGRRLLARGLAPTSTTPTRSSTWASRSTAAAAPAEAIPYLEKRLGWANQRGVGQAGARPRAPERRTGVACRAAWPASS